MPPPPDPPPPPRRTRLPIQPRTRKPILSQSDVLRWADEFYQDHGRWPTILDGVVKGTADQTWRAADHALTLGLRGLPGMSVSKVLEQHRGVRNHKALPKMSERQILRWADDHHARTGEWPRHKSGAVTAAPGETWLGVESALSKGVRGLPGGSSLAKLLDARRGVHNHRAIPPLTHEQVLGWADAHFARTGSWPSKLSGPVWESSGDVWKAVDASLLMGYRGLPKGVSLARLLAEHRGVRHLTEPPTLTVKQILQWADAFRARTGKMPFASSGPIPEMPGETWATVETALNSGNRGLRGGDTLARFLKQHRGKRNSSDLPPLTLKMVKGWIVAFHSRTGVWPTQLSGEIPGTNGECWNGIDRALTRGRRGLPAGWSLAKLKCGIPGYAPATRS